MSRKSRASRKKTTLSLPGKDFLWQELSQGKTRDFLFTLVLSTSFFSLLKHSLSLACSPWGQIPNCNSLLILNKAVFAGEISYSLFRVNTLVKYRSTCISTHLGRENPKEIGKQRELVFATDLKVPGKHNLLTALAVTE